MKTYQSYPLETITKEDIDGIEFYSTEDALRIAAAVKPIHIVLGNDDIPTLYYRDERNPETGEVEYSIHAVDVDVIKFLWKSQIEG